MGNLSTRKKRILTRLSERLSYVEDQHVVESTKGCDSVVEWISRLVAKGISRKHCVRMACNAFGVEVFDGNKQCQDDLFFFEGAVFHIKKNKFLHHDANEKVFENPEKHGLLSTPIQAILPESQKSLAQAVKNEYAKNLSGKFDYSKPTHLKLNGNIVSIVSGRFKMPIKFIDFSPLGMIDGDYLDKNSIKNTWNSPVKKTLEHIRLGMPGNAIFLCGDYSVIAEEMLNIKATDVLGESAKKDCGFSVANLDTMSSEEIKESFFRLKDKRCYSVFTSSSRNMSELLFVLEGSVPARELISCWGRHFFRSMLPSLCEFCKEADDGGVFSEELLSISESIPLVFKAGLGCARCVNGYRGAEFAQEDLDQRDAFVGILIDSYKTFDSDEESNEEMTKAPKSPFVVASKHYNQKDNPTLATSVIALLSHGKIQIKDAAGILV